MIRFCIFFKTKPELLSASCASGKPGRHFKLRWNITASGYEQKALVAQPVRYESRCFSWEVVPAGKPPWNGICNPGVRLRFVLRALASRSWNYIMCRYHLLSGKLSRWRQMPLQAFCLYPLVNCRAYFKTVSVAEIVMVNYFFKVQVNGINLSRCRSCPDEENLFVFMDNLSLIISKQIR